MNDIRLKVRNRCTGKFLSGTKHYPCWSKTGKNWKNVNQIAKMFRGFKDKNLNIESLLIHCEIIAYELVEHAKVDVKDAISYNGGVKMEIYK